MNAHPHRPGGPHDGAGPAGRGADQHGTAAASAWSPTQDHDHEHIIDVGGTLHRTGGAYARVDVTPAGIRRTDRMVKTVSSDGYLIQDARAVDIDGVTPVGGAVYRCQRCRSSCSVATSRMTAIGVVCDRCLVPPPLPDRSRYRLVVLALGVVGLFIIIGKVVFG